MSGCVWATVYGWVVGIYGLQKIVGRMEWMDYIVCAWMGGRVSGNDKIQCMIRWMVYRVWVGV